MSSWPGVVRDPESTLIQDFASISRPASAAPRAFVQRRGAGLHPVHRDHVSGQAALFGSGQHPPDGLRSIAFGSVTAIVQSVFVNDSEIELRLGIASFGGFK